MRWGQKLLVLVFLGLLVLTRPFGVLAQEDKTMVNLFYLVTCPHCKEEIDFLDELVKEDNKVSVRELEVSRGENRRVCNQVGGMLGAEVGPVPLTVIGEEFIGGFDSASTTGEEIKNLIGKVREEGQRDLVGEVLDKENKTIEDRVDEIKAGVSEKQLPKEVSLLGRKIQLSGLSLPMLTLVLGIVDGFNPCAMWILLFLISLLLNMDERLKMWALGLTFIFVSGVMYFFMMAAWLNLFLLVGLVVWIRWLIGGFAIGAGGWQLKLWFQGRGGGCETVDDDRRQKIFKRLKTVVYEEKLWLSLLGISVLAIGVNVFELLCSAGLPALFTSVLAQNNLPGIQYYLYILGYVVLFMLDDILVFTIAMITLKATGVQSKYANFARLVGGIVMIWIGYAMLFRPESLAF